MCTCTTYRYRVTVDGIELDKPTFSNRRDARNYLRSKGQPTDGIRAVPT